MCVYIQNSYSSLWQHALVITMHTQCTGGRSVARDEPESTRRSKSTHTHRTPKSRSTRTHTRRTR